MTMTMATMSSTSSSLLHSTPIYFSSPSDKYGEFSDLFICYFKVKGVFWPSSAHYYNAMKFEDTPNERVIRDCATPQKASELGKVLTPVVPHFEKFKVEVMREATFAKFHQNLGLGNLLSCTNTTDLVYHTNDPFWGDNIDGTGKNILGRLLMEVRDILKQEEFSQQGQDLLVYWFNVLMTDLKWKDGVLKDFSLMKNLTLVSRFVSLPVRTFLSKKYWVEQQAHRRVKKKEKQEASKSKYKRLDQYCRYPSKWRKRIAFAELNGDVEFTKGEHGNVEIRASGDTIIGIDINALPEDVKTFLHVDHSKNNKKGDVDSKNVVQREEEDENGTNVKRRNQYSIFEFLNPATVSVDSQTQQVSIPNSNIASKPRSNMTKRECIEGCRSSLDLLLNLPHDSEERKIVQNSSTDLLHSLKRFVEESSKGDEDFIVEMLQLFDDLSLVVEN